MIDRPDPRALADALVRGARAEVDLTPKPGLVDRHDNGSHPDLDYARMMRSIDLLPPYYEELIRLRTGAERGVAGGESGAGSAVDPAAAPSLAAGIAAGLRAEARMLQVVGANAHRGYIFLSGLVLLAACDLAGAHRRGSRDGSGDGGREAGRVGHGYPDADGGALLDRRPPTVLRTAIIAVARAFFEPAPPPVLASAPADHPGTRVRVRHGLGGVRTEALAGLPSVFEAGLPAYLAARDSSPQRDVAAFHALAALMQRVEDTTAVARCGLDGLARLRRDGRALQSILEHGDDPRPTLSLWNDEYRARRLTMGGVADCLALALALADA